LSSPKSSSKPSHIIKESNSYSKNPKPILEKIETDTDFYGYYLNQYSSAFKGR